MRTLFFSLFLLAFVSASGEQLNVKVSAKSAILINAETGAVLFDKNGEDRAYPASLTKIATCLYAVKKNKKDFSELVACPNHCLRRMNKSVKVAHNYKDPAYLLEPDGTHFMIKRGEEIPFKALLYGLMIASGNDAANYIAHYVGGNIPKFMKGMNSYLKEIGCEDTHFANPHGLHHPKHWSTAHDIAIITKEALKEELIRSIVSTKEYERVETNLQTSKKIHNKNQLTQPGKFFYPQAIGMKSGYHSDAGYTYTSVAKNGDRTLIAVLLGYDDPYQRYRDAIRLFDAAFNEEKEARLLFNKEENTFSREVKQAREHLKAKLTENIEISYYPAEESEITIELDWDHQLPPIKQGNFVGSINILDKRGNILKSSPLIATENVERGFSALIGDAMHGDWVCPDDLQKILILFLAIGMGLSLFGLYRAEGIKKRRKVRKG